MSIYSLSHTTFSVVCQFLESEDIVHAAKSCKKFWDLYKNPLIQKIILKKEGFNTDEGKLIEIWEKLKNRPPIIRQFGQLAHPQNWSCSLKDQVICYESKISFTENGSPQFPKEICYQTERCKTIDVNDTYDNLIGKDFIYQRLKYSVDAKPVYYKKIPTTTLNCASHIFSLLTFTQSDFVILAHKVESCFFLSLFNCKLLESQKLIELNPIIQKNIIEYMAFENGKIQLVCKPFEEDQFN